MSLNGFMPTYEKLSDDVKLTCDYSSNIFSHVSIDLHLRTFTPINNIHIVPEYEINNMTQYRMPVIVVDFLKELE